MLYKQIRRDAGTQKNRKILCFVTLKCFPNNICFGYKNKDRRFAAVPDENIARNKISPAPWENMPSVVALGFLFIRLPSAFSMPSARPGRESVTMFIQSG